ncbi:MAG: gamma-glutamyl-gamma-aminobutyrate hydrolase family protein [Pseudomonadales bacterium]|nr:gamma-glutamyl-gamma-aminobutyrate hydrolase family protein [Pseudomonadales bacterium]
MKKIKELKILLLQIRDQESVRREEHESFCRYSGLEPEQVDVLNVFDEPHFSPERAAPYDAVLVGGASEANVMQPERYPFVMDCQRLLVFCLERDIPVFASCFGFQLAVLALGGEIVHQETDFEMGTIPIEVSECAVEDPLFRDTPQNFMAVSVHQQKATTIPVSCELLAFTSECVHAFRVKGKPFWAFQFHPEVDKRVLVERLTFYRDKYTANRDHLNQVLAKAVETPESNRLLHKFIRRVLLNATNEVC